MGRSATTKLATNLKPEEDDTRSRLLKAAVRVFAERGYEGATVREICRAAGVNIALVNYHFGDKLELYIEVIRFAIDAEAKMELVNRALDRNADPCDALREIVTGGIERLLGERGQFGLHLRFLMNELAQPTAAASRVADECFRPFYDRIRSVVGRILNLPVDHQTTRLCTHSVMGQVAHYCQARPMLQRLWPEMKFNAEQRKLVANHIVDFSLAYLRSQRRSK